MKANRNAIAPAKQRFLSIARLQWKPQPLAIPQVAPALTQMDQVQRTAEVLRYSALKLEYWLSPSGNLREWLRWNTTVAIILSIPTLLIVPLVTWLLGQFATWSALLVQIASNLIVFPITGIVIIALLSAVFLFVRLILPR